MATSRGGEALSPPCWNGMGVHAQGSCMSWGPIGGYATAQQQMAEQWPQMAAMEQRAEVVVVVDPYDSGRFVVDELMLRGWPIVAVRSNSQVRESLNSTWDPSAFERTIVHSGDVLGTARSLREGLKRPIAVVAGSEPGAELADALAEVLSLRGNGTALSRCRRDKFFMQERLRECGLRACMQKRCCTVHEAMLAASEFGHGRPLVVKPCHFSGSDSVTKCDSAEAVADAAAGILSGRNDAVLIQEFLHGAEYIIDCVSLDGQHLVSGIWAVQRPALGGEFVRDRKHTVHFSSEEGSIQRTICEYVLQCLTALGLQNGASHSKVIYNEAHGPCLVKACPWIHSSVAPAVFAACAGREHAQAFLLVDALTEGGMYLSWKLEAIGMGSPAYELANYSIILELQKSDFEGDRVQRAQEGLDSQGYVVLMGPDPSVVEQEAAMIRESERAEKMYACSTSTSSKTPTPPACSDDEGTWGKCGLFLPLPCDPTPRKSLESQMAALGGNLLSSPCGSPELLPKACAEFVLDGVLE